MVFLNRSFDKKRLKALLLWFRLNLSEGAALEAVEILQGLGFRSATQGAISLGLDDLKTPTSKGGRVFQAQLEVALAHHEHHRGNRTPVELFQHLVDTWHRTSQDLTAEVVKLFHSTERVNPVYMMAFSGARGNLSQVRQLVGMRGLMADPRGQIVGFPILSNFREGLTITEYFVSCYGARKGVVDTAIRTADAGYLTRRLADVSHHFVVRTTNCGTHRNIRLRDIKEGQKTILPLASRLVGRVLGEHIPPIAHRNEEITPDLASKLASQCLEVSVRSPLSCSLRWGVCQLCYGWGLSEGRRVTLGEAVGIIAAQSIGEPGTQLTLRTFHTGGVFSGDLLNEIRAPYGGSVFFPEPLQGLLVRTPHGQIAFLTKVFGKMIIFPTTAVKSSIPANLVKEDDQLEPTRKQNENKEFSLQPSTVIFVRQKEQVSHNQLLAEFSSSTLQPINDQIEVTQQVLSEAAGQVWFKEIEYGNRKGPGSGSLGTHFSSQKLGGIWVLSGKPTSDILLNDRQPFANEEVNVNTSFLSVDTQLEFPLQLVEPHTTPTSLAPYSLPSFSAKTGTGLGDSLAVPIKKLFESNRKLNTGSKELSAFQEEFKGNTSIPSTLEINSIQRNRLKNYTSSVHHDDHFLKYHYSLGYSQFLNFFPKGDEKYMTFASGENNKVTFIYLKNNHTNCYTTVTKNISFAFTPEVYGTKHDMEIGSGWRPYLRVNQQKRGVFQKIKKNIYPLLSATSGKYSPDPSAVESSIPKQALYRRLVQRRYRLASKSKIPLATEFGVISKKSTSTFFTNSLGVRAKKNTFTLGAPWVQRSGKLHQPVEKNVAGNTKQQATKISIPYKKNFWEGVYGWKTFRYRANFTESIFLNSDHMIVEIVLLNQRFNTKDQFLRINQPNVDLAHVPPFGNFFEKERVDQVNLLLGSHITSDASANFSLAWWLPKEWKTTSGMLLAEPLFSNREKSQGQLFWLSSNFNFKQQDQGDDPINKFQKFSWHYKNPPAGLKGFLKENSHWKNQNKKRASIKIPYVNLLGGLRYLGGQKIQVGDVSSVKSLISQKRLDKEDFKETLSVKEFTVTYSASQKKKKSGFILYQPLDFFFEAGKSPNPSVIKKLLETFNLNRRQYSSSIYIAFTPEVYGTKRALSQQQRKKLKSTETPFTQQLEQSSKNGDLKRISTNRGIFSPLKQDYTFECFTNLINYKIPQLVSKSTPSLLLDKKRTSGPNINGNPSLTVSVSSCHEVASLYTSGVEGKGHQKLRNTIDDVSDPNLLWKTGSKAKNLLTFNSFWQALSLTNYPNKIQLAQDKLTNFSKHCSLSVTSFLTFTNKKKSQKQTALVQKPIWLSIHLSNSNLSTTCVDPYKLPFSSRILYIKENKEIRNKLETGAKKRRIDRNDGNLDQHIVHTINLPILSFPYIIPARCERFLENSSITYNSRCGTPVQGKLLPLIRQSFWEESSLNTKSIKDPLPLPEFYSGRKHHRNKTAFLKEKSASFFSKTQASSVSNIQPTYFSLKSKIYQKLNPLLNRRFNTERFAESIGKGIFKSNKKRDISKVDGILLERLEHLENLNKEKFTDISTLSLPNLNKIHGRNSVSNSTVPRQIVATSQAKNFTLFTFISSSFISRNPEANNEFFEQSSMSKSALESKIPLISPKRIEDIVLLNQLQWNLRFQSKPNSVHPLHFKCITSGVNAVESSLLNQRFNTTKSRQVHTLSEFYSDRERACVAEGNNFCLRVSDIHFVVSLPIKIITNPQGRYTSALLKLPNNDGDVIVASSITKYQVPLAESKKRISRVATSDLNKIQIKLPEVHKTGDIMGKIPFFPNFSYLLDPLHPLYGFGFSKEQSGLIPYFGFIRNQVSVTKSSDAYTNCCTLMQRIVEYPVECSTFVTKKRRTLNYSPFSTSSKTNFQRQAAVDFAKAKLNFYLYSSQKEKYMLHPMINRVDHPTDLYSGRLPSMGQIQVDMKKTAISQEALPIGNKIWLGNSLTTFTNSLGDLKSTYKLTEEKKEVVIKKFTPFNDPIYLEWYAFSLCSYPTRFQSLPFFVPPFWPSKKKANVQSMYKMPVKKVSMPFLCESDQITFAISNALERGVLLSSYQKNITPATVWQLSSLAVPPFAESIGQKVLLEGYVPRFSESTFFSKSRLHQKSLFSHRGIGCTASDVSSAASILQGGFKGLLGQRSSKALPKLCSAIRLQRIFDKKAVKEKHSQLSYLFPGQLVAYGEKIAPNFATTESGQVLYVDSQRATFRKAQTVLIYSQAILAVLSGEWIKKGAPLMALSYQKLVTGDIVQGLPKIEQFFEAPLLKDGTFWGDSLQAKLNLFFQEHREKLPLAEAVRKGFSDIQRVLVEGVQRVYIAQGVLIADKHLEVIVRQMTCKGRILYSGDTGFLRNELVSLDKIESVNQVTYGQKALYHPQVRGITDASLESESFLSAASFQETTRVLSRDAVIGKTDLMRGLKERVIVGSLIQAGTGLANNSVYNLLLDESTSRVTKGVGEKS